MKFLKLQVENFMALASAEVELVDLCSFRELIVGIRPPPVMGRANQP